MSTWTAIAHPGLEASVAAELQELGFATEVHPGWVRFQGEPVAVCSALPMMRTPDRVLLQVVEGKFQGSDGLASLVRAQRWKELLAPESTVEIAILGHGDGVRFKDSVQKRVSYAIAEALKGPRIPERYGRPRLAQRVSVRVDGNTATISLDAVGELMHRRGWRIDISKAPLRENLAAAMLRLSGWTPDQPLLDPFCGSGTLPIEAALWAAGRSPFDKPQFASAEWPLLRGKSPVRPKTQKFSTRIYGSDRDLKVLQAAQRNAARAGVTPAFAVTEIGDLQPPASSGFLVTNPPWGHRLNDGDGGGSGGGKVIPATLIFNRFGVVLQERFKGWKIVFLAPEQELARKVSPRVRGIATFPNGGVRITAWGLDLSGQ